MGVVDLLALYARPAQLMRARPAQLMRARHVGVGRRLWRGVLRVIGWALALASICLAAWRIWQGWQGWQTNEWY
jgi:hypothetical protein